LNAGESSQGQDPLDIGPSPLQRAKLIDEGTDSPAFDAQKSFQHLYTTASLPDLLRKESDLLNDIRDLDSERQSLVYNHHTDLLNASETIRTMKSRAELLDSAINALSASFESISQLSESLKYTPAATTRRDGDLDPLQLAPVLKLPQYLKALQNSTDTGKREADLAWGSWEPALRTLEEAGVEGVADIGTRS
jgi:hypothetical protein